jgi:HEAT repeat protein
MRIILTFCLFGNRLVEHFLYEQKAFVMRKLTTFLFVGFAAFLGSGMIAQEQPAQPDLPRIEAEKRLKGIWKNLDRDQPAKDVIHSLETMEQLQAQMRSMTTGTLWMQLVSHRDPEVRARIVRTMADMVATPMDAAPTVAEKLMRSLNDRDNRVRAECFFALARLGSHAKPAIPRAIEEMKNDDPRIRRGAVTLIGVRAQEQKELIPYLIAALDDADGGQEKGGAYNSVSLLAMFQLEKCKSDAKDAVPKLVEFVTKKKNSDYFQGVAMTTLIRIDPKHPLPLKTATEFLKRKNSPAELRKGAGLLVVLGPHAKPAIPDLIVVLKMPSFADAEEERQLKSVVLSAFGQMGPTAKEVLPLLRSMLPTDDSNLRAYINQAIENIERPLSPPEK